MSSDGPGQREVAYRLFAAEYDDANYSYSESDEERAPNYVVTPTGARVNRLFAVGVLTEVERVNDEMLRGRVVDPTGAFVLYAGQYEPDEQAALERTDPPAFVAVTGKANTFEPEDGDRVYTSIRPESINTVDAETRDRWTVQAAEQTVARVGHAAAALSTGLAGDELRDRLDERGVEPALADGITRALVHYETTPAYLDAVRRLALDAARVVAGERNEARELTLAPDDSGDVTAADLLVSTPDADSLGGPTDREATDADSSGVATGAGDGQTGGTNTEPAGGRSPARESNDHDTGPADSVTSDATATGSADTTTGGTDTTATGESDTVTDGVRDGTQTDRVDATGTELPDSTTTDRVDTTSNKLTDDTVSDEAGESEFVTDKDTSVGDETGESEFVADPDTSVGDETDEFEENDDLGEFGEGDVELSDELREEIDEAGEKFDTGFQSGTDVDDPGEAGIPTPETETDPVADPVDSPTDTGSTGDLDTPDDAVSTGDMSDETVGATEVEASEEETVGNGPDGVDDPQEAVLAVMTELDDGTGADRETLVTEARERHELDEETVADAIESALMDGKCYEPDERSLKPI
jgi:hypothetical protein